MSVTVLGLVWLPYIPESVEKRATWPLFVYVTDLGMYGSHTNEHSVQPLVHCYIDSKFHWFGFKNPASLGFQMCTILIFAKASTFIPAHSYPLI